MQKSRERKNVIHSDNDYSDNKDRVTRGYSELMITTLVTQYAIRDLHMGLIAPREPWNNYQKYLKIRLN